MPTTGHSAAQGFSQVSGIPYGDGLYKNNYVGRTFIQPSQSLRDRGVKLKLNPLPDSIRGKRLVVVDDTIVRGTTTKQIVQALREAGAAAVHFRITCPPIQWPCFYGIDFPTRQELIAADLSDEQIRSYVGADSLGYLSLDGMVAAAGDGKETYCRACFDGEYPFAWSPLDGSPTSASPARTRCGPRRSSSRTTPTQNPARSNRSSCITPGCSAVSPPNSAHPARRHPSATPSTTAATCSGTTRPTAR